MLRSGYPSLFHGAVDGDHCISGQIFNIGKPKLLHAHLNHLKRNVNADLSFFNLGHRVYYVKVIIAARRIAGLKALKAQKQRGSTIPAANRRVGLDHNSSDYKELVVTLDRLIDAINESNEYAASDPDDRDRQLSELRSAKDMLTSSGPIKTGFIAAFASVLTYLGTKFADSLIGNLAETVLDLLQRVIGS